MTRIAAVGGYIPRLRLPAAAVRDAWGEFRARGIEQTAIPDADEDALTMGYAAARRALDVADRDAGSVARLHFGTSTPPVAESEVTARLRSMLGLPDGLATATYTGSTRAGVTALTGGVDADDTALIVAADCPRGEPDSELEHAAGAGAAAILLAPEGGAGVLDTASHAEPFPGTRYRKSDSGVSRELGVREYERRAFRQTLAGAIDRLDHDPGTADAAAIQAPDGDRPYRVADALGIPDSAVDAGTVVENTGDLGAASAPFGLVTALAADADAVLVAGYGSGAGATALLINHDDSVPAAIAQTGDVELSYTAAQRRRGRLVGHPVSGGGAHVSLPSWRRTLSQRHRLEAGACRDCGELAFPPSGACRDCGANSGYDPVELPRRGTVVATTTIQKGGAPPEFADQQARSGAYDSAIVAFEGSEDRTVRVPLQVVLAGTDEVTVGDAVATTVRHLYDQEDIPRYAMKGVPADTTR